MKTMEHNGQIKRVSDSEAMELAKKGAKYIAKAVWKKQIRDAAGKAVAKHA